MTVREIGDHSNITSTAKTTTSSALLPVAEVAGPFSSRPTLAIDAREMEEDTAVMADMAASSTHPEKEVVGGTAEVGVVTLIPPVRT